MKRQILLTLVATCLALPSLAQTFSYEYEGNVVKYTVIDENAKTCRTTSGDYSVDGDGNAYYYAGSPNVSGTLKIPSVVYNSSKAYTVVEIGEYAFAERENLTYVEIPSSVNSIGHGAFEYCISLKSVNLPNSITSIGNTTFFGCSNLQSIELPNSLKTIGTDAFAYSGITSIVIPTSVTSIGNNAFNECKGLTSVSIMGSDISIGRSAFFAMYRNCLTKAEFSSIEQLCNIKFYCWDSNPLSFAHHLFINGEEITELEIPESVTSIGNYAFYRCSSLTSITIPNSVTSIGNCAFYECTSLTSITSNALMPPYIEKDIVSNFYIKDLVSNYNITVYVPYQSLGAYKSASYWKNFTNIIGIKEPFEATISGLHYVLNPMKYTATVTYAEQNSLGNYGGMQSVIVPETVEYEGERYTVTGIGDEAFNNCWGLKAVSLPSTLQSIGKLAFGYCTSLRSVTIPDEVTIVDDEAFTGCSALASVQIGSSVETIGDYAFFGCTGLASLHVPESVKTIGENAFMGIHWINEVHAKAETPADAPVSAFSTNAYRNATLVVPDGTVDTYKAHPTWSNFLEIRQNSDIPTNIQVVDGAIVVKGTESVRVYNTSGAEVYSGPAGRIELPSGIYLVATDSISKKVKI